MAVSNLGNALSSLVTQIAAVDGTGSYTYDLSGTDAVYFGFVQEPPTDPFVMITDLVGGVGETGNTLEAYTHRWTVTVVGWVSASTDSYLARIQAATDLYHDVLRGIAADRTLGGYARDVYPVRPEIGGTVEGVLPSWGYFVCDIELVIKNGVGA